ncbi:MAG: DNA-processing protein DprA, partial [Bacteroidales bacterium]|nr:DNA-processing protein DprA [Bacteroidales bacterium]
IVYCFNQSKTIVDFFESDNFLNMQLTQDEFSLLSQAKAELGNYSFMVEDLLNQGYEIIPITSKEYSPELKLNLKYNAPVVLYIKGNKQILKEKSIAIVGSRNANESSLLFTDNVAKNASSEYKVVVSGFAKGVDKQALDSALKYKGQSIIVLPQGITTFGSGMKKYYKSIIEGDVLVLSTFHPNAPWSVELAMARNSIIYGLASEIYVAQSDEKGGTWSGVCGGLKKNRPIYVRVPDNKEKCANLLLIEKGAMPVDINGTVIQVDIKMPKTENDIKDSIISMLKKGGSYKFKDIKNNLNLSISENVLREILNCSSFCKTKKGGAYLYSIPIPEFNFK